jgi:MerR family transcriptional regulator/heat shock protein HspR
MASRLNEPVFIISVAARLVEMHPQTLRKYEREGLIAPSRTVGNLRLYSDQDIERLRQVKYLVEHRGLNLAGVQLALELTSDIRTIREHIGGLSQRASESGTGASPGQLGELHSAMDQLLRALGFVDESALGGDRLSQGRLIR